ncbi:hypothetical protein DW977_14290 [Ruminococcus sp. AM49-10BH]|nr:hypothetical protein DW977_14290 [Ruminococcus sp. AM49-10BH]
MKQIPYNKRSMETLLNVIAETYNCNLVLYNKNGYISHLYISRPLDNLVQNSFLMPSLMAQRTFSVKA